MAQKKKPETKDKELFGEVHVSRVSFYLAKNTLSYYNTEKLEIGRSPTFTESSLEKR